MRCEFCGVHYADEVCFDDVERGFDWFCVGSFGVWRGCVVNIEEMVEWEMGMERYTIFPNGVRATDACVCYHDVDAFAWGAFDGRFEEGDLIGPG